MNLLKTDIEGVFIVEPRVFEDGRGYFFESYSAKTFAEALADAGFRGNAPVFVQDNESRSSYGVVRGLHFQTPPHAQAKLVRCVVGRVLDVAVDIRQGSPTYGKWVAVELSGDNHRQLFLPKGFAHGFSVLSETALFQYKCDELYHPESEGGIDMRSLPIDWRIDPEKAVMSPKDLRHPSFNDFVSPFTY